jgi:hypothetical protein
LGVGKDMAHSPALDHWGRKSAIRKCRAAQTISAAQRTFYPSRGNDKMRD